MTGVQTCALPICRDAESNAAEDHKRRELVEERNKADSLIYSTERTLKEHGAKLPEAERKRIQDAIAALNKAKDGEDVEAIRRESEQLMNAAHALAQMLYQQSSAQGGAAAGAQPGPDAGAQPGPQPGAQGAGKPGENVVDADFEVIDDDKNKDKK